MKIGKEKAGKRGADFSLRDSHRNAPAKPQTPIPKPQSGFTLVELLVAMALFAVLMSGVVMLFVGSVRSAKTGYQQIDAFEKARSTLNIFQNDLVTGFTSQQSGDPHSFYGTPIGMTFVGLVSSSTGSGNFNVARITYVVYNRSINKGALIADVNADVYQYRFPEAWETPLLDRDGNQTYQVCPDGGSPQQLPVSDHMDAYPYPLLRYVEPGATDLNTFPLCWDVALGGRPESLAQVRADLSGIPIVQKTMTDDERERFWAASCEIWIRALAGGDADVYDFWTDLKHPDMGQQRTDQDHIDLCNPAIPLKVLDPLDYMVVDNILSTYPPNYQTADKSPGARYYGDTCTVPLAKNPNRNRHDQPFCARGFFDYDMLSSFTDRLDKKGNKVVNFWWNDPRSYGVCELVNDAPYEWQCDVPFSWDPTDTTHYVKCTWDPRLPEIVSISFWLMFESPYPGAPDFQRPFSLKINIPAASSRTEE